MADTNHKFTCDFGDGVFATGTIDVAELRKTRGKTRFFVVERLGERKESHKPKYLEWMMEVHQAAAELLPGRILYAFMPRTNVYEFYAFEPGKHPVKLDKPPES
jgi:hypothetical protein